MMTIVIMDGGGSSVRDSGYTHIDAHTTHTTAEPRKESVGRKWAGKKHTLHYTAPQEVQDEYNTTEHNTT